MLNYLDFDFSEDAQGYGSFEAMASTQPAQVAAVRQEMAQVLDWAFTAFPGLRAPLDEGGEWDFHVHGQQEWAASEALDYDEQTRQFSARLAEYCQALCAWSPITLRLLKRGMVKSMESTDMEAQLRYEVSNIRMAFGSEDAKEARKAFFEKRKPVFQGR